MRAAPSLPRHKAHKRLSSGKRQLTVEVEKSWNREIPRPAALAIPWLVLSSFVDNLSDRIPDAAVKRLRTAIEGRDVMEYLKVGAEFGVPQKHESHADYFVSSSVLNLFKKFPWIESGLDPEVKARERSSEAEMLCRKTNARLRRHRQTDFASKSLTKRLDVHGVFHTARRKIQNWLGPCDPQEIFTSVRFGPGGCVGTSRPETTPFFKFAVSDYTVSSGAYWYAMRAILQNDAWVRALLIDKHGCALDDPFNASYEERDFSVMPFGEKVKALDSRISIVDYNKVTYVPKDASTHRAIAVEAHLNVMLQLAVGDTLKGRLRAAGCDLTKQDRNQELAYSASLQWLEKKGVSTLDLRMASDCLAIELVRELLPGDWYELLDALRAREGKLDGKVMVWEKFSSMGNGFTFELESMIFFALAQSVSDLEGTTEWYADTFGPSFKYGELSVFGDDIIVPTEVTDKLVAVLRFCGFQTNLSKSFSDGPFRESCGKDYYMGVLVRPFYMKRPLSQVKDLIHLLNNVKGLIHAGLYELASSLELVESLLDPVLRTHLRGPRRTTGDEYIWSDPDDCHRSYFVVWDTDLQTWRFPKMRQRSVVSPQKGRHHLNWIYTQVLYANTDRQYEERDSEDHETLSCAFSRHLASGGSAVDVVLSGQASPGALTWIT